MDQNNTEEQSFAQYGEDVVIVEFFKKLWNLPTLRKGRFLEIGAMDGVSISNCRRLALAGWSGVCIEPNPILFSQLLKTYEASDSVKLVCACVGNSRRLQTLHLNNEGLATASEKVFKSLTGSYEFKGECVSPTITPDDIVGFFGDDFDFVSIDAEGMDMEIVSASNRLFKNTSLLCVETDEPCQPRSEEHQARWKPILEKSGFTNLIHQSLGNTLLTRP